MNYAPPFRPGALRGGSHVHGFSPDGTAVSFTYEDDVLARLGAVGQGSNHDLNQRNVGVAVPAFDGRLAGDAAPSPRTSGAHRDGGVAAPENARLRVARSHPRNHDGGWFSVVVTRTVNRPRPGSDEISRAYGRQITFTRRIAHGAVSYAQVFVVGRTSEPNR